MLPKQIHQENETRVSCNTRSRSKRSIMENSAESSIVRNSKRKRKDINFSGTECAQKDVRLSTEWIINNSLHQNLESCSPQNTSHTSTTSKKKISRKSSSKDKGNPRTPKLMNNPSVSNATPGRHAKSPKVSSTTLSLAKKQKSINRSTRLKNSKTLSLVGSSSIDSQEDNTFSDSNNMQLKLHVSDTDVNIANYSLNCGTSTVPSKTRSKSMPSVGIRSSIRKFLKTTKILLKSPKSKSKIRKSRSTKSPVLADKSSARINRRISHLNEKSPTFINKCDTSESRGINTTKKKSIDTIDLFKGNVFVGKESIVLLKKLSNIATGVSSPLLQTPTRRSLLSPMQQKVRSHNKKVKNNSEQRQTEMGCVMQESTVTRSQDSYNANETTLGPLMSSTPKDRQRHNETVDKLQAEQTLLKRDTTFELDTYKTATIKKDTSLKMDKEEIAQDDDAKGMDETYELIEPKTPNLRKRVEMERMEERERKVDKKKCKVRFTSPSLNSSYDLRCRRLSSERKKSRNLVNIASRSSVKKNILKSSIGITVKKSNSCTSVATAAAHSFTPNSRIRHQRNSSININISSASPYVSHIKNSDVKPSSAKKKVPNFSEIHKKLFARSESVVDAKKRLKDRHTALTATKMNNSMKIKIHSRNENLMSTESTAGTYNRFGFKIKKHEATDCISRNKNVHLARSKEQNRAILKGVRTNRRFELQMKSRNIKL